MADNIKCFEPGTTGSPRTIRATDLGTSLVQHVLFVDASDNSTAATHDGVAGSGGVRLAAEARSSAPTAVANADDVKLQASLYGVQRNVLSDPTGAYEAVGQDGATTPTGVVLVGGDDGSNAQAFQCDSNGRISTTAQGAHSHGAAAANFNPLGIGIEGRSTLGAAVDDGDSSRTLGDLEGRLVTSPHGPRGTFGDTATTLTGGADTVVAAGATGVRRELTSVTLISNGGTSFALSDGTKTITYKIAANTTVHLPFQTPKRATSTATAWTCTGTSGDIVDIHYVETKL